MPSVLLVEAGTELRSIAGFLVESGFELAYEATGPEALDRLASYRPDVIVLNVAVAADDPALIERLRLASQGAAILQIVSSPDTTPALRGAAADAVVTRPLIAAAVAESIWRLTERDGSAARPPTQ